MPGLFDDIKDKINFSATKKNVELLFSKYHRMKIKISIKGPKLTSVIQEVPAFGSYSNHSQVEQLALDIEEAKNFNGKIETMVNSLARVYKEILTFNYIDNETYAEASNYINESQIAEKLLVSRSNYYQLKKEAILNFAYMYDEFNIESNKKLMVFHHKEE